MSTIDITSIRAFNITSRDKNDANNKIRERLISSIINDNIPQHYYTIPSWLSLKEAVLDYIRQLINGDEITTMRCIPRGGRRYNYDFTFIINEQEFNVELKFNAQNINDAPQFVSPVKPSKYLSSSYEEFFYDNYLPKLSQKGGVPLPERDTYLSKIHSTKPECMADYQDRYYKGSKGSGQFTSDQEDIDFYNYAVQISKDSIRDFILQNEINTTKLTEYLKSTQNNKKYMLFSNNMFHLQIPNLDDYEFVSVSKNPELNRYELTSISGKVIKVLLRWKNGNGVAFPAFQIK